jgi:hypothetical protein
MVRFSIIWALACPAYVGMAAGVFIMLRNVARGLPGIAIGLFFGGAMALPLCASNGAAAIATRWLTAGQPFAIQFAAFLLLAAGAYYLMLSGLNRLFRATGGIVHGSGGWARQLLFFGLSAALALAFMIGGLRPAGTV